MAFAEPNDLIVRYDSRLIGDLCTDDGETLSEMDVLLNNNVASALEDASGEIVVALTSGGRYSEEDLAGLTGYSLKHLVRVCCDIAMALLIKRRPGACGPDEAEAIAKQSREHLKNLSDGKNVFGIPAVVDAGYLELAHMSTVDIQNNNVLPERMSRYFPGTSQRMPRGR